MWKWILDNFLFAVREGHKSKVVKISLSTLVIIIIAVFLLSREANYYKSQIDKIPLMEKTIQEHSDIIKVIPDMKDDIKWLVRKQGGEPTEEKRLRRHQ
jgi:hypothetical protein